VEVEGRRRGAGGGGGGRPRSPKKLTGRVTVKRLPSGRPRRLDRRCSRGDRDRRCIVTARRGVGIDAIGVEDTVIIAVLCVQKGKDFCC
jgi:hypothetical protein